MIVADWVVRNQSGYKRKYNISLATRRWKKSAHPVADRIRSKKSRRKSAQRFSETNAEHECRPARSAHLSPWTSYVHGDARTVYASAAAGPRTNGPRVFRQHRFRRSSFNHFGRNQRAQRTVKQVEARLAGKPIPQEKGAAVMSGALNACPERYLSRNSDGIVK